MRDLNNQVLTIARRDNNEKSTIKINESNTFLITTLDDIQESLFNEALAFKKDNTFQTSDYEEFKKMISNGGFVECGWDGNDETESKIKKETNATIGAYRLNKNTISNVFILKNLLNTMWFLQKRTKSDLFYRCNCSK